jgi:hypothetical protein|tara:strand:- start:145 stop:396 length:252 start_codon:yes stop_codon:yes gene_type:complete
MTLAQAVLSRKPKSQVTGNVNITLHMPAISSMIRHLDLLYSKLLEKQEPQEDGDIVNILGKPHLRTRSWFNPGQGIKQSAVVQ